MISAETPLLFSKACELFILELTLRAWLQTTDCKRRALQRCDISRATRQENMLDFLNRVVPYDHEQVLSFSLAHAWKMDLS
ncbi:histone-fold-containing protein [Populus alba x Populus x berolinensis]|nr:histone-fold-containing protein [Populus alba x Populus x berolinensis]